MSVWPQRAVNVLDLVGVAFILLILLGLLVEGLAALAGAQAASTTKNIDIMLAILLWLGRASAFAVVGARAAGRHGNWWLAPIATVVAPVAVVMIQEMVAFAAWGWGRVPALFAVRGALQTSVEAPGLMEAALAGALLGPAAALLGPRIRGTKGGSPSPFLIGVGAVVVVVMAAAVAEPLF